jgi:hypothetical protein
MGQKEDASAGLAVGGYKGAIQLDAEFGGSALDGDAGSLTAIGGEGRYDFGAAIGIAVALAVKHGGRTVPGYDCLGAVGRDGDVRVGILAMGQNQGGEGAGTAHVEDGLGLFKGAAVGLAEFRLLAVGVPFVRPSPRDGLGGSMLEVYRSQSMSH